MASSAPANGTEIDSAFAAYVIAITELKLAGRLPTRSSCLRLSPKLARETASEANASRNQAQFSRVSTCSDWDSVWRSTTMTLTRTTTARAASALRRTPYRRGARAGTGS